MEAVNLRKLEVSKASIGRLPEYLKYLKSLSYSNSHNISATTIAKNLGLGDVQVRKDLSAICNAGKPKIGYNTNNLINSIEQFLGYNNPSQAIIIGAGKLGRAILDYSGFFDYGLEICAAFDNAITKTERSAKNKLIYPLSQFENFCKTHIIQIAIIAVPNETAQEVCDLVIQNDIKGILSFATCKLKTPTNVTIHYENIALTLANLNKQIKTYRNQEVQQNEQ